jgi:hypothetical protein
MNLAAGLIFFTWRDISFQLCQPTLHLHAIHTIILVTRKTLVNGETAIDDGVGRNGLIGFGALVSIKFL